MKNQKKIQLGFYGCEVIARAHALAPLAAKTSCPF
jgi:hypothetical protein